jgi:hypothetical protein
MKGLIVRQPWLDLILSDQKTWEMRSKPTKNRGKIALIQSGSGLILGTCDLEACFFLNSVDEFEKNIEKHCVASWSNLVKYRWAWVVGNPKRFESPKPYKHPHGAVIWVNLPSKGVGDE